MEEEKRMGRGGSCLVVKDKSLRLDLTGEWKTPEFILWLQERGLRKRSTTGGGTVLTGCL